MKRYWQMKYGMRKWNKSMLKDEEIVEKRYWERRRKYTGIDTGIYSEDEFLEFSEARIFDKAGVLLPAVFQDMSQEEAKKKYPSEQRPQIIKTSKSGAVNFAFNLLAQELGEEQLEAVLQDFLLVMKRIHPTNICLKIESGRKNDSCMPYASMEFTSTAINENLYNMVVISPIGEELLMMLFNCPFDKRTEWLTCLMQIRESIVYYREGDS